VSVPERGYRDLPTLPSLERDPRFVSPFFFHLFWVRIFFAPPFLQPFPKLKIRVFYFVPSHVISDPFRPSTVQPTVLFSDVFRVAHPLSRLPLVFCTPNGDPFVYLLVPALATYTKSFEMPRWVVSQTLQGHETNRPLAYTQPTHIAPATHALRCQRRFVSSFA